ncbi:hypothetical protein MNV49_003457 [Pseudohyphozyma bogoriensis]|nr:hypothetical protein MNV49_003457 [Pseudohyphozyma bogoriensis]
MLTSPPSPVPSLSFSPSPSSSTSDNPFLDASDAADSLPARDKHASLPPSPPLVSLDGGQLDDLDGSLFPQGFPLPGGPLGHTAVTAPTTPGSALTAHNLDNPFAATAHQQQQHAAELFDQDFEPSAATQEKMFDTSMSLLVPPIPPLSAKAESMWADLVATTCLSSLALPLSSPSFDAPSGTGTPFDLEPYINADQLDALSQSSTSTATTGPILVNPILAYPSFLGAAAASGYSFGTSTASMQASSTYSSFGGSDAYRNQLNAGLESPLLDDSPYTPPMDTVCPSEFDTSPAWAADGLATPQLSFNDLSLFGGAAPSHPAAASSSPASTSTSSSPLSSPEYSPVVSAEAAFEAAEDSVVAIDPAVTTFASPALFVKAEPSSPTIPLNASPAPIPSPEPSLSPSSDVDPGAEATGDDYAPPVSGSTRKRKASSAATPKEKRVWNGTRPADIMTGPVLDQDAPIQTRNYKSASSTSRKLIPKAIARSVRAQGRAMRKRSGTEAPELPENVEDLEAEEGGEGVSKEVLDLVEQKRAQNTLAARKSRARKADHLKRLEEEMRELKEENELLKVVNEAYRAKYGDL